MATARQPLTVGLISTERGWHGGEEQARLLLTGLRHRGHRCLVLARRGGAFAERMVRDQFAVCTFPGSGRSPWAIGTIRRQLRRCAVDAVHFNDAHAVTAGGLATLGWKRVLRVGARRVDFPVRSPYRYRMFCDRLICVSQAVAGICQHAGVPRTILRVVPDGVDPERVASGSRRAGRLALGVGDTQRLLLSVATLADHKGHRHLIDAMPRVLARCPQAILALAGDGPLAGDLRRQAAERGVAGQVRLLGFRHDVPDLLAACDLFVHPSHMEGMGSSLIDAMLAGRPIVTTTAGGIPEVVGVDGDGRGPVAWLTPPRSSRELAEAILEALADDVRCGQFVQLARQRALQRFTDACVVQATLEVYCEGLAERRVSAGRVPPADQHPADVTPIGAAGRTPCTTSRARMHAMADVARTSLTQGGRSQGWRCS